MNRRASKKGTPVRKIAISRSAFAAITAVEGLKLSPEAEKRVFETATIEKRRAEVLKAYTGAKKRP
jgi:hypothetical protein